MDRRRAARVRRPPHSWVHATGTEKPASAATGNPGRCPQATLQTGTESQPGPTTAALARADERQRVARDLHDGVQTELVSLMLRLKLAEEDRNTPPALAATFVALEDHAAAALASLREIAYDIYPLAAHQAWPLGSAARARGARTDQGERRRNRASHQQRSRGRHVLLLLGGDPERRKTRRPLRAGQARPVPPSKGCSPRASQTTVWGLNRHRPPTAPG